MVDPVGDYIIRYYDGPAKYISIVLIMYNNNTIVSIFCIVNRPLLDDIFGHILLQEQKKKKKYVYTHTHTYIYTYLYLQASA